MPEPVGSIERQNILDQRSVSLRLRGGCEEVVRHPAALCFMENVRCEMRLVSLHGHVAGALPAQPGGKQINLVLQEMP